MADIFQKRASSDIKFYADEIKDTGVTTAHEPIIAILHHLDELNDKEHSYMLKMHLLHIAEDFCAVLTERTIH